MPYNLCHRSQDRVECETLIPGMGGQAWTTASTAMCRDHACSPVAWAVGLCHTGRGEDHFGWSRRTHPCVHTSYGSSLQEGLSATSCSLCRWTLAFGEMFEVESTSSISSEVGTQRQCEQPVILGRASELGKVFKMSMSLQRITAHAWAVGLPRL